jgi:hypothetical protein
MTLSAVRSPASWFASESIFCVECLTEEQALQTEIGRHRADLIALSARKRRNAKRIAQPKALIDLRIGIGFAAGP